MSSRVLLALVVALVVAPATWLLGWWAVIPVAVVTGWLQRRRGGRAGSTAVGAAIGWVLLLAIAMRGERFATVSEQFAGVLRLPWPALMLGSLLLPMALAWSTAALVACLTAPRALPPEASDDPFAA